MLVPGPARVSCHPKEAVDKVNTSPGALIVHHEACCLIASLGTQWTLFYGECNAVVFTRGHHP